MSEDAFWYEAAFVAGITNAVNVVADGLIVLGGGALITPVDDETATDAVKAALREIREFYGESETPLVFRVMARDAIYLTSFWKALHRAFSDNRLSRRVKEALGFAVSLTTRSSFGTALHLTQMRRFGVTDVGVMEIVGVTQMFSSYTKIADTLQLQPDMGNIAPEDPSPAPGELIR
jgi:alkylhydroperoxidase/carboxymuconolactone decarboxylase family protein YurZ